MSAAIEAQTLRELQSWIEEVEERATETSRRSLQQLKYAFVLMIVLGLVGFAWTTAGLSLAGRSLNERIKELEENANQTTDEWAEIRVGLKNALDKIRIDVATANASRDAAKAASDKSTAASKVSETNADSAAKAAESATKERDIAKEASRQAAESKATAATVASEASDAAKAAAKAAEAAAKSKSAAEIDAKATAEKLAQAANVAFDQRLVELRTALSNLRDRPNNEFPDPNEAPLIKTQALSLEKLIEAIRTKP